MFAYQFAYLTEDKTRYVGVSRCGELMIVDDKNAVCLHIKWSGTVASAALKDNLLAVVLGSNELALIDIKDGKHHIKQDDVYVLDSRIASPYFLGDLIVFPTLDSKIVTS